MGTSLKPRWLPKPERFTKAWHKLVISPCAKYFPLDRGDKQLTSVIKHLLRCNKSLAQKIIKKWRILRERAKARPTPMMTADHSSKNKAHRNLNIELTGSIESLFKRCFLDLWHYQTRNTIVREKEKKTMMNWNNFDNQNWRQRFFANRGFSMVYLCLESFGGVLHDIPINV